MNIELLERVKARIRQEPNRFHMQRWGVDTQLEPLYQKGSYGLCGTAFCIGGWAGVESGIPEENIIRSSGAPIKPEWRELSFDYITSEDFQELLDIPNNALFYVHKWPIELLEEMEYLEEQTFSDKNERLADLACRVIDDYIDCDGDWDGRQRNDYEDDWGGWDDEPDEGEDDEDDDELDEEPS